MVTAVFNRAETVAAALASVHSQSWPTVEHVVIDGGSTDGTLQILKAQSEKLAFLVSERDGGIYDALNKGIARCTGDVVGFLHADDLFESAESLARVAAAFEDASVDAVYGDLVYVRKDDTTRVVRQWTAGAFHPRQLSRGWMPPHPTFYVRREVYLRLGGFDTRLRIAADYDCMLRFLCAGVKLKYIPHVQVRMRLGGASNRSLRSVLRKSSEDYVALRRNGVGGATALLWKNISKLPQFFMRTAVSDQRK